MTVIPEPVPENDEGSNLNGVKAALAVGGIMVAVYLLSSFLQVYENELLNSVYRYPDEFAFLRGLFQSPWSTDLIDWQDVVLFQLVPFLLFFYFAVRMRISALGRIIPMVIALMVVGACLLVVRDFIGAYQSNISSLLLSGSFTLHNMSQSNPLSGFLSSISTPLEIWFMIQQGVIFSVLGVTGVAFGSFSGETPYWTLRNWLESGEEEPQPDVMDAPQGVTVGAPD
ncbi:MAG: hypothetical protein ABSA72_02190 [Nitrososphaerales archaeon]